MTTKEIGEYLLMLASVRMPGTERWYTQCARFRPVARSAPAYHCFVCHQLFDDVQAHCEVHRAHAEVIRDDDLVPLTPSMQQLLRDADLGNDDTVVVGDMRCIPRPFALVLTGALSFQHLRWAFNRLWHDDDGFGDAVCAAAVLRGGVAVFIEQQYRSDEP
jgi:hypothetical protein